MSFDVSRVFTVKPQDIEAVRPWLQPFLEEFERVTCLVTAEDVMEQAKHCDAQLWSYHDGAKFRGVVVTRVHTNTIGKVCSIFACIGIDAEELMQGMHDEIERWARQIGCYALEIVGRAGWQRKLQGYRRTAIVLEKRLTETH